MIIWSNGTILRHGEVALERLFRALAGWNGHAEVIFILTGRSRRNSWPPNGFADRILFVTLSVINISPSYLNSSVFDSAQSGYMVYVGYCNLHIESCML